MTRDELQSAVSTLTLVPAIQAGYFDGLLGGGSGGSGDVSSVNGKTGEVVIDLEDLGGVSNEEFNSQIQTVTSDLATIKTDNTTLKSDMTKAKSDITKNTTQIQTVKTASDQNTDSVADLQTKTTNLQTSVLSNTTSVATKLDKGYFSPESMVAFIGDSRTAQNESTSNLTVPAPLARSQAWWMQTLSKGRLMRSHLYNFGVSGDSVKDVRNRVVADTPNAYGVKPSDPGYKIIVIQIGTNSVNSLVDFSDMVADMVTIVSTLKSLGKIINVVAEWPRGYGTVVGTTGYLSPDSQKLMYRWANYLRSLRSDREITVIDVWPEAANPSATDATPIVNILNQDGLHNSTGIGFLQGGKIATENLKRVTPANWAPSQNGDVFSAANPYGCLNANPMLSGNSGTISTGANGNAPTGYTLSSSGGVTVVGSSVTYNNRPCVKLVISGTTTSTNAYVRLRYTGVQSSVSPGDVLVAGYEYAVEGGYVNFSAPTVMIDPNVATDRVYGGLSLGGDNQIPASITRAHEGLSLSARYTVPATVPASIGVEFRPMFTATGVDSSLTIYIFNAFIRKV